jgi:hypothetical protein
MNHTRGVLRLLVGCVVVASAVGQISVDPAPGSVSTVAHWMHTMQESASMSKSLRCAFCDEESMVQLELRMWNVADLVFQKISGLLEFNASNSSKVSYEVRYSSDSSSSSSNSSNSSCDTRISIREADTLGILEDELRPTFFRNDSVDFHCFNNMTSDTPSVSLSELRERMSTLVLPLFQQMTNTSRTALNQTLRMLCSDNFDHYMNTTDYRLRLDPGIVKHAQPMCNLTTELKSVYSAAKNLSLSDCKSFLPIKLAVRDLFTSLQPAFAMCMKEVDDRPVDCASSRALAICEAVCASNPFVCPPQCSSGNAFGGLVMHMTMFFKHKVRALSAFIHTHPLPVSPTTLTREYPCA